MRPSFTLPLVENYTTSFWSSFALIPPKSRKVDTPGSGLQKAWKIAALLFFLLLPFLPFYLLSFERVLLFQHFECVYEERVTSGMAYV